MRLLLFIILLLPSVCFGQFGNFKQVRLVGTTDSTLIPGVAQIRFDPSTGKIRFGNGSSWFTYGGGMSTNLSNFDALSSTGFPVRTGSNTWAQRTLQAGNGMSVTNGDGVSGNPSYSWGGTLSGNVSISGGGNDISLGTDISRLGGLTIYAGNSSGFLMDMDDDFVYGFYVAPNFLGTTTDYTAGFGVESENGAFGNASNDNMIGVAVNVGNGIADSYSGIFKAFLVDSRTSQSEFKVNDGTGSYNSFVAQPTYNTTGTYSGTARGFYYNPTLTSTTGLTNIAFENTSGQVRLNTTSGLIELDTVAHLVGRRYSDGALVLRDASTFTGTLDDVLEAGSTAEISSTIDILADDGGGATLNWVMDLTGDQFLFDVTNAGVTTEASLRITDPYFSTESSGGFRGERNSSTNNTPEAVWTFQKTVEGSGGGANGIGARLYLGAESATNNTYRNGYIDFVLTDATAATAEGEFRVYHVTGGSAELALTIGGADGITDDDVLDRVSASTASGTIDLDVAGKKQRVFTGSASFATAKNLTISNETSKTAALVFTFEITDLAAVLTMETNVLMQDSRFDGDDWTATATGVYKMTGTYDGTNWLCEISANPYQ